MMIASRLLHLQQHGRDVEIPVTVFAPEADANAWRCRYEIGWPGDTRRSDAVGGDSVQALVHALQKIGAEIYTSDFHKSGSLCWDSSGKNGQRQGYGFPVIVPRQPP